MEHCLNVSIVEKMIKFNKIKTSIQRVLFVSRNIDNNQEQELREKEENERMVREATEACLKEIVEHLAEFISNPKNKDAKFEDWIEEVHPENVATSKKKGRKIDPRFYFKRSDHRMIWNMLANNRQRESLIVHPRTMQMLRESLNQSMSNQLSDEDLASLKQLSLDS